MLETLTTNRAEAVRAAVKTAALNQLKAGGPAAVALNAIARELGVSGPALYRYFKNRDALLTALAIAYQVQCRLSDEAPVRSRGFDHTTHGAIAAAAGASHALGLDARRTESAIAIAWRRLFTLPPLPPRPLFRSPCLNSCITRPSISR